MKKKLLTLLLSVFVLPLWAQNIQISQIDANNLLFKGTIDIYFSLTGSPYDKTSSEDFTVHEKNTGELAINELKKEPGKNAGIDFILLIDNSGSMYDESYQGSRRINQAKLALSSFLDQLEKSGDRAAVYSFNTSLEQVAAFGTDIPELRRSLSAIKQPASGEAYTELYNSLTEVSKSFPLTSGRRAVILLSDGQNYSVYQQGGEENMKWGKKISTPEDIIQTYLQAGITLDGINISDSKDPRLDELCGSSGGRLHEVRSTEAISNVYTEIRERITNEYMIRVTAPPLSGSIGEIEIVYKNSKDSRVLLFPVLFGGSSRLPVQITLLVLLPGLGAIVVLYLLPFERPVKKAQIQSMETNQKTILNEEATVIGAGSNAHYTIAGNPGIDAEHATIVHDEATGVFTLISSKTVRVNNRKAKERVLTPGDVIRIEGSTIIFDAPEKTGI